MIPRPIHLRDRLPEATFIPASEITATRLCCDSRQVTPGSVFVAIRGCDHDGHDYVREAARRGAQAAIVEQTTPDLTIPQCVVTSTAVAWSQLSLASHGDPHRAMTMAGITGTNGKSSTAWLLKSILQAARHQTGLIGTIEYHDGRTSLPASMTTPDAWSLAELLDRMRNVGTSHAVMEVSSHALDQERCAAIRLAAAAITNITHDHLDYHGTEASYRAAKRKIADLLHCDAPLLINADDGGTSELLAALSGEHHVISYGEFPTAELRYRILSETHRSQRLRLTLAQGDLEVRIRQIGRHNASNALVAAGLAEQLGVTLAAIRTGLEGVSGIPGRLERIDEGQPFQVVVDYAHTPDALRQCLATLRKSTHGRLICVFGAGGDRDRKKRPAMAQATFLADNVVVTSDNPRTEPPRQIVDEILAGYSTHLHVDVEIDRRTAIQRAIEGAGPGDTILIAGKGHELSQMIGQQSFRFDDREVARELLREREASYAQLVAGRRDTEHLRLSHSSV